MAMQEEKNKTISEQNSHPRTNILVIVAALAFLGLSVFLYIKFDGKNARVEATGNIRTESDVALSGKLGSVNEGQTAPSFTLSDFSGKNYSLASFKGKPTVVVFEATWCTFCHQQSAEVERLRKDLGDKYNVVSIDLKEDVGTVLNAWQERQNERLVLLDTTGEVGRSYGIVSTPTNIFLNSDGTLYYKHPGLMGYDQFKQVTDKLI